MDGRQVITALLFTLVLLNTGTTEAQVIHNDWQSAPSPQIELPTPTPYYPAAYGNQPYQEQSSAAQQAADASAEAGNGENVCQCENCRCGKGCKHAGSLATRERLFGNLFGAESKLAEKGIVTDFILGQYFQGVTNGGNEQTNVYGGKVDMYFTFPGEKFGANKGFFVFMHAETRFGQDISSAAGSLTTPNAAMLWPLPGDYHGTNITGLYAVQAVADGKAAILGGKLNALDLVDGLFPEVGGGRESFFNVNALVTAQPWFRFVNLSLWGAGAWTYAENKQIQHGIIAFGLENVSTTWDVSPSFDDGVGMLGWLRFFHEIQGKPGYVMLAAGGATRGYQSLDPQDWIVIPGEGLVSSTDEKPWDIAGYFSQVLWQDPCNKERRIRFFSGGTIADDNPSFSNWTTFANIEAFGLNRSRPGDRMGIAGWYNSLSPDVINLAGGVGVNARDNWGMELYYNREITPWFHLTPDLQVLQNSNADTDTSLVLGLRAIIDL